MMDKTIARRLLLEVTGCLDRVLNHKSGQGVPYFLTHGTALGAYRDHGFTPNEDDIDIGLLAENFVPNAPMIVYTLTQLNYEVSTLVAPLQRCWAIKARKEGIGIDLVSFIRWTDQDYGDDGRIVPSTLGDFCGYYPNPMLEQLETVSLFDRSFLVPSPIEDYLSLEYGDDWRTPSDLHAYTESSRTRIDGFLSTRGAPADLLNRL